MADPVALCVEEDKCSHCSGEDERDKKLASRNHLGTVEPGDLDQAPPLGPLPACYSDRLEVGRNCTGDMRRVLADAKEKRRLTLV